MIERRDDDHPNIDEARQASDRSRRRSESDMRNARENVKRTMTLAEKLRRLREENGFSGLFDDTFGGGRA